MQHEFWPNEQKINPCLPAIALCFKWLGRRCLNKTLLDNLLWTKVRLSSSQSSPLFGKPHAILRGWILISFSYYLDLRVSLINWPLFWLQTCSISTFKMGGHFDLLEVGSSLVMGHTCRNSMEIFFQIGILLAHFLFFKDLCAAPILHQIPPIMALIK